MSDKLLQALEQYFLTTMNNHRMNCRGRYSWKDLTHCTCGLREIFSEMQAARENHPSVSRKGTEKRVETRV